mmetsp:Transcript_78579/g.139430  ORF Transcript_78579/g.139430 Transcript_78579/m.139430 type:complete len:225 (-) Transcript_78579:266-940(-)
MPCCSACEKPFDPKAKVAAGWTKVNKDQGRVSCEDFASVCIQEMPVPVARREAFTTYLGSLFEASTAMMLPSVKSNLGKHCFGYGFLLAGEFYADKPRDQLKLAASSKPKDKLKALRAEFDHDWEQVLKDDNGRVTLYGFVNYFLQKHNGKLDGATKGVYTMFLQKTFESCLKMMGDNKTTLDGHAFRYGDLMAGEFYFAAAKNTLMGGTSDNSVTDVLGIAGK